MTSFWWRY